MIGSGVFRSSNIFGLKNKSGSVSFLSLIFIGLGFNCGVGGMVSSFNNSLERLNLSFLLFFCFLFQVDIFFGLNIKLFGIFVDVFNIIDLRNNAAHRD